LYGSPRKGLATQHRVLVLDVHFKKCKHKTEPDTNPKISWLQLKGTKQLTFVKLLEEGNWEL